MSNRRLDARLPLPVYAGTSLNTREIPESDWKIWRQLAQMALERYCSRVLTEVAQYERRPGSAHKRYSDLFKHLGRCDKLIATVFDDLKRSNAFFSIAGAADRGVLSKEELASFSEETQAVVNAILQMSSR